MTYDSTGPAAKPSVRDRHKVAWPSLSDILKSPAYLIAFGFGVGLLRPGSGTWGSVLAALLWPVLTAWLAWDTLGMMIVASFFLGCVACHRAGQRIGVDDHVGMVWDEIVAVWMLFWVLPQNPWVLLTGWILFRVFDVTKPFPIRIVDARVKGGLGVMIDDLVAGFYAWLVMLAILMALASAGVRL